MRMRPATPLSILLFAAFALLLLSVLSTPVITSIHLASYGDIAFGVFGFCDAKVCSGVRIGYDMSSLSPANSDFSLPSNARNSLSNLLIVHPIAALFTLILLVLAVISHLHSPAHSPRYLLALLILALPTFLLSLLAFLVDILIFLPHVQWAGWIVLGATILIAIAGVVMCGMRRTVVSKKARRKRIEDNAAMNGQEFYASQARARERAAAPGQPDKLPEYATFEVNKTTPGEPEGERIPLNPRSRTVSPPIPGAGSDGSFTRSNTLTREPSDRSLGYGPTARGVGPLSRPMPPGQIRNQYSNGALQTGASGSSGPYGVPPPQRGGYDRGYGGDVYGERGPPLGGFRGPTPPSMYPPAGGLTPPPRRGPSPGQFGPRPPASNSYGGGGPGYGMGPPPNNGMMGPPPQGVMRGGQAPFGGMGGPPPGAVMTGARGGPTPPSGPQQYDYPEGEIVDERREFEKTLPMAAAVGIGGARGDQRGDGPGGPAELDIDGRPLEPPHTGRLSVVNENGRSTPQDEYVPPRQAWQQQHSNTPPPQSRSPQPVELPAGLSSPPPSNYPPTSPTNAASSYYEDVVPAFDTNLPHPRSLTPGYPSSSSSSPHNPPSFSPPPLPIDPHRNPSNQTLEDLQDGQRSPTMSLSSNFTSISQRPPNPNWQPPPQQQQYQQGRRGLTASQVLGGNPDFVLPGNGRGGQRGRGGGPVGMGR